MCLWILLSHVHPLPCICGLWWFTIFWIISYHALVLDSFEFSTFSLFLWSYIIYMTLLFVSHCLLISPGIMLLIFGKSSSHVPLKILSIEDGTVLKSFNHLLHRNKKVDFIEQFNEKLLVKQENENLQILDVSNFPIYTWVI